MTSLDYFYKLLSRREYSVRELTQKAQAKGFSLEEIAASIEDLQQQNYQSDARVVESLITSYHGKYGKASIRRKCMEKGINLDLFEEIWQSQMEEEESGALDELKEKVRRKYKIDDFRSIEQKTRVKLWNYLQYRGFNPGEVLAQWRREEDEMVE
ncbi:MAG TPA: RecX family transcriptional regulator [Cyanobacteria bacterium UBA11149]|nr:RecX family transcriptional regulator [Cyanobacteria bacterium UBA11367]HBE59092.1 RecX family transcriptional regulator [Cyanobacteria bacterium UBA11366]HBK64122.1 RecX family transcriptional regulator [Cyanobacteria bacterium UBA11166]HBR72772.1 RecX family transcriptional regulator [Cyanobacteria bacterium UBA11159]HBS67950.1 RecX family transcriptional regulator [Cyanobacteria bacterium UBA11153]HBW87480.1 RecX family transcriptional regulator [Cyanobacteria bacterium UBA11149]HCA9405